MFPLVQRSQQHGFVIFNIRGRRILSLRLFPILQRKALVRSVNTSTQPPPTPPPTTPITTTAAAAAAKTRTPAKKYAKKATDEGPTSSQLMFHAGLPIIAFSLLATWVVKNSLEGKTKEHEVSTGKLSRSERQARMDQEHQDMMEKLNKIRQSDFDNTKRIERPEEILERRRREREARNVWYRRWWRWMIGKQ